MSRPVEAQRPQHEAQRPQQPIRDPNLSLIHAMDRALAENLAAQDELAAQEEEYRRRLRRPWTRPPVLPRPPRTVRSVRFERGARLPARPAFNPEIIFGDREVIGHVNSNASELIANAQRQYVQSTCAICTDIIGHNAVRLQQHIRTEHWDRTLCRHLSRRPLGGPKFCATCMRRYAIERTREGRSVPCPDPDCTFELVPCDVAALLSPDDFNNWMKRRQTDHKIRLTDPNVTRMARECGVVPCPGCSVLVAKGPGCDTVVCTCGERFNMSSFDNIWSRALKSSSAAGAAESKAQSTTTVSERSR